MQIEVATLNAVLLWMLLIPAFVMSIYAVTSSASSSDYAFTHADVEGKWMAQPHILRANDTTPTLISLESSGLFLLRRAPPG